MSIIVELVPNYVHVYMYMDELADCSLGTVHEYMHVQYMIKSGLLKLFLVHVCMSLQVIVISLITGILSFPNPYTRANASEVIKTLFSQCGPEDNNDLW